ncbi:MAG: phosphoglucosamine mutase [Candidatus Eisenbacteria bacterium]|nr:phosphoglucosamine mutase [Candidatus Eisenbacteria bacterium]
MTADPIVSVSGVRGIVGESLTSDFALRLGSAFGTTRGAGRIVVGRDTRPSGRTLVRAVLAGLSSVGCHCIDTGIVPTPTVLCMVGEAEAKGGIIITASHNGPEWNGLKFVSGDGSFLDEKGMKEVVSLAEGRDGFAWKGYKSLGESWPNAWAPYRHVRRITESKAIDVWGLRKRNFSVVADCVNGAASTVLPVLLSELGCKVNLIFDSLSGEFPRGPEPVAENIGMLGDEVKKRGADIGFAFDPDGDRISIVASSGRPFGEENSIVLASRLILTKLGGTLVVNASTTSAVDEIASRAGCKVVRSKVGERNVVELMRKHGAILGGEGNGGVILPQVNWGRDGIAASALFLQALLEWGGDSDTLLDSLPKYFMVKEKITCEKPLKEVEAVLLGAFAPTSIDRTDGIKLFFEDGWLHVRKSGTEPVVRIMGEARVKGKAEAMVGEAISSLGKTGA